MAFTTALFENKELSRKVLVEIFDVVNDSALTLRKMIKI